MRLWHGLAICVVGGMFAYRAEIDAWYWASFQPMLVRLQAHLIGCDWGAPLECLQRLSQVW